jgi:hypothetical protein
MYLDVRPAPSGSSSPLQGLTVPRPVGAIRSRVLARPVFGRLRATQQPQIQGEDLLGGLALSERSVHIVPEFQESDNGLCSETLHIALEKKPEMLQSGWYLSAFVRVSLYEAARTIQPLRIGHKPAGVEAQNSRTLQTGFGH